MTGNSRKTFSARARGRFLFFLTAITNPVCAFVGMLLFLYSTLCSIFLEDGTLVNETLVREGYASASAFPPDITKKGLFAEAEIDARENQRGLWNPETCNGK